VPGDHFLIKKRKLKCQVGEEPVSGVRRRKKFFDRSRANYSTWKNGFKPKKLKGNGRFVPHGAGLKGKDWLLRGVDNFQGKMLKVRKMTKHYTRKGKFAGAASCGGKKKGQGKKKKIGKPRGGLRKKRASEPAI